MGKTNTKEKSKHDRGWELAKQASRNCNKSFATKIEQARKKEIILNTDFINRSLKCSPNFIGCYAEDELEKISLTSFPCFLIVNIDSSNMIGSHWIAIGIFTDKIEIFDSLGFKFFNWPRLPCTLLTWLHHLTVSRRVIVTPVIQSNDSYMCGFYCIYYVIRRVFNSFDELSSCFDSDNPERNDNLLLKFFK